MIKVLHYMLLGYSCGQWGPIFFFFFFFLVSVFHSYLVVMLVGRGEHKILVASFHFSDESSYSDGMLLIEVDRVLKPGGYFVLTSPGSRKQGSYVGSKKGSISTRFEGFIQKLCWNLLAEQEETFVWQKTTDSQCYASR